jgi:tRNA(fMet)-specific endonuclease VapC
MFLSLFEVLPFDHTCLWVYKKIRSESDQIGRPIGVFDTMIAAPTISTEPTLATNNTKDFARLPGIELEDWA